MRRVPRLNVRSILSILLCVCMGFAQAQTRAPQIPAPVERDKAAIDSLRSRVASLEVQLRDAAAELRTMDRIALFLGGIVGLGFIASLVGSYRTERRAAEAHAFAFSTSKAAENRSVEAFQLATKGEEAAQSRAEAMHQQFLAPSRETLVLVNATLTLAKEASERAAHSQDDRLAESLAALNDEAAELLMRVRDIDSRELLRKQDLLERLKTLADGLNNYEASRIYLPQVPKLTPPCQFARGMQFHITQQFTEALKHWRLVAHSPDAEKRYQALALYWIGYELQSLGQFPEAADSYANAERVADELDTFELKRLELEMAFFTQEHGEHGHVVDDLKSLLQRLANHARRDELTARVAKTRVTLGNVLHVTGLARSAFGNQIEAQGAFKEAIEAFRPAQDEDHYARFGLAEALYQSGDKDEAITLFRDRVRDDTRAQGLKRPEPRARVLVLATELMCCMRVPEFQSEVVDVRQSVLDELNEVNGRLNVYSPFHRKPLERDDFQKEVLALVPVKGGKYSA